MVGMAFLIFSCGTGLKTVTPEKKPMAEYSKAIADYEAGKYSEALEKFNRMLTARPDHPESRMIRYYRIFCHYHTGDNKDAITLAMEWLKNYPDSPDRYKIQKLAGEANRALGLMYESCFWMTISIKTAQETGVSGDFQGLVSDSIADIISNSNEDDLNKIRKLDGISQFLPSIYLRQAELALEKRAFNQAKRFATLSINSASENDQPQLVTKGRYLLSRITDALEENFKINKKVIGCLLPLKGDYSLYGEELLNGIQLGMDLFSMNDTDITVELIIKNTNAEPEDTLAAVTELIIKDKVIAIIGPLSQSASVAAAKKAQEHGVPIITFSQKPDITKEGDQVFRNYLTPAKEVDALVTRAVNEMGMFRFGIFYPDTSYGNYFMNIFWEKVEEMGGEITAVESYKSGDTDFAEGIKKMTGLYYPRPESVIEMLKTQKLSITDEIKEEGSLSARQPGVPGDTGATASAGETASKEINGPGIIANETIPDTEITPDEITDAEQPDAAHPDEAAIEHQAKTDPVVDFDAVFIPDNSQNIALIAPQFPFYNVFNVPFLGTSLWLSDELINTTSDYLQGAIFPVGFYINNDSAMVMDFVKLYRETYGKDPGILAATGYDTIKMIKNLLMEYDISTRTDFQKALFEYNNYYGVTGEISFDEQGEVKKIPMLLTIHGKSYHILK